MASKGRQFTRLSSKRLNEISGLAEEVVAEFGSNGRIDLLSILKSNDISVSYGLYDDAFDGMLEHESGAFHIYCNLNRVGIKTSTRARFTLGHELGHYYIDQHRNELIAGRTIRHGSKCEYESLNPAEQEADYFASNLLMPEKYFKKAANSYSVGLPGVIELSKYFNTSMTSTAIRYVSLGIKPSVVIKWSANGYQWRWLSDEARLGCYWKTINSLDQIPNDSPTGRAFAGNTLPENGYFESGSTASAWFSFVKPGSYKDILLIEQAVPLGIYGVLTFIYPVDGEFPHIEGRF